MTSSATIIAIPGIPDVRPGMSLPDLLLRALHAAEIRPSAGDVLAVGQKVVSKAEGTVVDLAEVTPRAEARRLAGETGKDPRLAAAATLLQGQCDEGTPAVLIRGVPLNEGPGGAAQLLRDPARDLFR